jgi:DNA-binding NtrC family response regulator
MLLEKHDFDLLVSDYRLPGGDGLSLISKARADSPEMQAVLMTGVGNNELEKQAAEVAQGYMAKPFDMLDLLLLVQQVLGDPANVKTQGANGNARRKVLILEDDAGLRRLYTLALLKAKCYQIDEAATISEARNLLNMQVYDILISDVRIGRDRATDLLEEYSERLEESGTKVVMCSAFGQYRDLPIRVDHFLEKPISLDQLVNVVGQLANIQPAGKCN